jgi:hypothetical protein
MALFVSACGWDEGCTGTRDVIARDDVGSLRRLGEPVIAMIGLFSFGGWEYAQVT